MSEVLFFFLKHLLSGSRDVEFLLFEQSQCECVTFVQHDFEALFGDETRAAITPPLV